MFSFSAFVLDLLLKFREQILESASVTNLVEGFKFGHVCDLVLKEGAVKDRIL